MTKEDDASFTSFNLHNLHLKLLWIGFAFVIFWMMEEAMEQSLFRWEEKNFKKWFHHPSGRGT